jgi:hypothetical protein
MASSTYGGGPLDEGGNTMSYTWQVFGKFDTRACSVSITSKVVVLQS